ncbi:MAG: hypothetical protein ACYDGO_01550 [Smithellaceae bacterium]
MEQKQMAKQIMDFNKKAFDNSFSAMSALQDQTEKLVLSILDKAAWFPEEGKKVINDWVISYKKGRDDFKASADESYKKVADFFAQEEKQQTKKAGKK